MQCILISQWYKPFLITHHNSLQHIHIYYILCTSRSPCSPSCISWLFKYMDDSYSCLLRTNSLYSFRFYSTFVVHNSPFFNVISFIYPSTNNAVWSMSNNEPPENSIRLRTWLRFDYYYIYYMPWYQALLHSIGVTRVSWVTQ